MRQSLQSLFNLLFAPSPALSAKPEVMRRARAISALLFAHLCTILATFVLLLAEGTMVEQQEELAGGIMLFNATAVAMAYALSRTRHIVPATYLAVVIMISSTFASALLGEERHVYVSIPWLICPVVMIAVVSASGRHVAFVAGVCISAMAWFSLDSSKELGLAFFVLGLPVFAASLLILIGAMIQGADIKELEEAKQAARSKGELLNAILDHSTALIYAKDRQGRYIAMNRQMRRFLNTASTDVIGQTDAELFAPELAAVFTKNDARVVSVGDTTMFQADLATDASHHVYLHQKFPLLGEDERIYAVACVATDITSQSEAEHQIKVQQQQLLTSSKLSALGQMAAGVAHEINNPLSIIYSNARQLEGFLKAEPARLAEASTAAGIIGDMVKRISHIVKGLRSLSQPDSQLGAFKQEDLASLLADAMGFCIERCRSHGIRLIADRVPKHLTITCNRVQISQVVLNLLNNAFDAVHKHERAWIRVQVLELPDEVEISVEDSGRGISEDLQRKIFQPFFTTKAAGLGTGLGLSLSRDIVEHHRGKIMVDPQSLNTRFVVILPKQPLARLTGTFPHSA